MEFGIPIEMGGGSVFIFFTKIDVILHYPTADVYHLKSNIFRVLAMVISFKEHGFKKGGILPFSILIFSTPVQMSLRPSL